MSIVAGIIAGQCTGILNNILWGLGIPTAIVIITLIFYLLYKGWLWTLIKFLPLTAYYLLKPVFTKEMLNTPFEACEKAFVKSLSKKQKKNMRQ